MDRCPPEVTKSLGLDQLEILRKSVYIDRRRTLTQFGPDFIRLAHLEGKTRLFPI